MTIEFENDTCVMDHNGNKANFGEGKKFVDKQAAIDSLDTNKGCTNCTDSVDCTRCNHMTDCNRCNRSAHCTGVDDKDGCNGCKADWTCENCS